MHTLSHHKKGKLWLSLSDKKCRPLYHTVSAVLTVLNTFLVTLGLEHIYHEIVQVFRLLCIDNCVHLKLSTEFFFSSNADFIHQLW